MEAGSGSGVMSTLLGCHFKMFFVTVCSPLVAERMFIQVFQFCVRWLITFFLSTC